jgi:hypothetical protein
VRARAAAIAAALACACVLAAARPAAAQRPAAPPRRAELRVDAVTDARVDAVQALAGVAIPIGTYTRLGLLAGGGAAHLSGATVGSVRADAIARFALDPYRQSRWGVSAGGGISVRHEPALGTRGYLALVLDAEGPARGGVAPAIQLGLGGGVRLGVALRGAGEGWR